MGLIMLTERFKTLREALEEDLERNLTEEEKEFIVWIVEKESKTKNVQYVGTFVSFGQS